MAKYCKSILSNYYKLWILFASFLAITFSISSKDNLFLGVSPEKYLIGDYNPSSVLTKYTNEREKDSHFLRPDTLSAYKKMMNQYEEDRKGRSSQHLYISSAFRDFNRQKKIWESKYKGDQKMSSGSIQGKTPQEIISLILQYSSAPGTSRHHWGTDIDFNVLKNTYYKEGSNGAYLYQWLKENAHKFGFCQPYNEHSLRGNKGYFEERWHWSYAPVSNKLVQEWNRLYKEGSLNFKGKFLGSEYLGNLPDIYVNSINADCYKIK